MKLNYKEKPILTISFEPPFKGICKSNSFMKHVPPNIMQPIAYIQKAKNAKQEDFDVLIKWLHQLKTE